MGFIEKFTPYMLRGGRRQPLRGASGAGWRVAYGNVSHAREEGLWRDEGFAVLEGPWETYRGGRFVAVGEARLTNRAELLTEIDWPGGAADGARAPVGEPAAPTDIPTDIPTDLGIIVSLWQAHGRRAAELLTGAYAFCVWDRERETLWLVRDRVGAETLYYTTEGGVRYAGARSREVVSGATREVDAVAVRDYLCCAFVPGGRTMWRALREVRPGTVVRLPEGETTSYWQVEERIAGERMPLETYGARLRAALERVVSDCLPVGAPVGVYLSGGLDSSCVAALAARLHDRPVHTYSIHFGPECPNELEFSGLVASHYRTTHHVIEITPEEMWDLLPETLAHLDDPIGDPLTVPNLILGRAARAAVGTILNGEGGDPCFGGPKNQPMLLTQLYRPSDESPGFVDAYLASFQKCAADLPRLLRAEVWEEVRDEPSVFADAFNSPGSYLNNLMFVNTRFKGADHILTKVNNLTRAAGLRGHSPLFDDRVVELSLEIPPEYKLEGAREKAVLKAATADLLPARILERPKSGMMVPVQRWFRERWHRRAAALLLARRARTRRFLDQDVVRDWLNYRGDVWARYGVKLWLLVSLELWLQTHGRD
jgi:asparagine synthase (glutamine-hydrolysing)